MLSIRLSRVGKKNKPMYRVVIMEKNRDPYGRALEILGSYNPHSKELLAKTDRVNHWIKNGAQMSPTVNNLFIEKGIIKGDKVKASIARKKKKGGKEDNKKDSSTTEASDDKVKTDDSSSKNENKTPEEITKSETPNEEAVKEDIKDNKETK